MFKEDVKSDFQFERFYTFHGSIRQYFSPGGKFTFAIGGEVLYITNTDSVSALNNYYLLGGIESVNKRSIAMTGFHSNEIPVKKLAGLSTEIDFELLEDFHVTAMADIFTIQETDRSKGYSLLAGYGIGAGYMSIIGPIKIGIMHGNYAREEYFNKTKGYISIGFRF
jgi:outer membrane translocation and assembly module TamA